ncbi:unnamed protein product [Rhodiola kirilowii]
MATSILPPPQSLSFSALTTRARGKKVIAFSHFKHNNMDFAGMDSDGRTFTSADEMWREAIGHDGDALNTCNNKAQWYHDGVAYWQNVEASVDGVLGGYGHVNDQDIKGSEEFLKLLLNERLRIKSHLVALDCGSGIGRITKNLLIKHFNEVDLVEPVSHFLEAARENLAPGCVVGMDQHSAVNFFCTSLQEFAPESGRYDVIWVQWCIGHLTDDDFVSFFKRAKTGLKPGGFFILKENIARTGFVLDKEDRSITRSDLYFRHLFKQCGLHLYKIKDQKGLPDELFAVKMYALTTDEPQSTKKKQSKRQTNRPGIIK